jgi:ABC-type sugar transport system ATPase subunit
MSARRVADQWQVVESDLVLPDVDRLRATGAALTLGLRPEHIEVLASDAPDGPWVFDATVKLAELLGADALLNLSVMGQPMLARVGGSDFPLAGQSVRIRIDPARLHAFHPKTGLSVMPVAQK